VADPVAGAFFLSRTLNFVLGVFNLIPDSHGWGKGGRALLWRKTKNFFMPQEGLRYGQNIASSHPIFGLLSFLQIPSALWLMIIAGFSTLRACELSAGEHSGDPQWHKGEGHLVRDV